MKKKRVDWTVLIWDQCGMEHLQFAVFEGDYTHLNRTYINEAVEDDKLIALQEELHDLIYNADGTTKPEFLSYFPRKALKKPFTRVIVAGFYP